MPTIRIEPPASFEPLDAAIARLHGYDWVLFTSVNGVDGFFARLEVAGKDTRALPRVGSIGPATSERLKRYSIRPDCQPAKFTGAALVEALAAQDRLEGRRVLLPRAADVPPTVRDGLTKLGAAVVEAEAYRTAIATEADEATVERLIGGEVDFVTFTSSSTVRGFVEAMGRERLAAVPSSTRLVAIGPVTSETARELGLTMAAEAKVHTIPGLLDTLLGLLE
jgi:uroporphyrinogen III methyltransferase/synthase